jgi:hypothetical protein
MSPPLDSIWETYPEMVRIFLVILGDVFLDEISTMELLLVVFGTGTLAIADS